MAYPDRILVPDEDVVARLHPQSATVVWAVVRLLSIIGAASFGMAIVPAGPGQATARLGVLGLAVVLVLLAVLVPLLRWWTSLVVVTTHRLLHRSGVLSRRGRDVALAQISDLSFSQTLWQRVTRSGTLRVTSDGEGVLELERVPGVEGVQTLLHHMIAEDDERRHRRDVGHRHAGQPGWAGPRPADARPTSAAHRETSLTDLLR